MQPRDLDYHQLPSRLVEAVPALADEYEEYLRRWHGEEPGSHNVYGDVLNPYLVELLSSGDPSHSPELFRLLDELSASDDHRIRGVAAFTVFERIMGEGLLGAAWRYIGESSRSLVMEVLTHHFKSDETVAVDEQRYQRRWREEIEQQGGMENMTAEAIRTTRARVYDEFGIRREPQAPR